MPKPMKSSQPIGVRTRRAYFDFRHGQLHVRTAFPTTGGFGEQATLFCLHGSKGTSRSFAELLPEIADVRSVYAPDLPGCGESDTAPRATVAEAVAAMIDLAADLRLRQIDVLGLDSGAEVALELAAAKPDLVRRLVLAGLPTAGRLPTVQQRALVIRIQPDAADGLQKAKAAVPNGTFVDVLEQSHDSFEAAPDVLARQVGSFLSAGN